MEEARKSHAEAVRKAMVKQYAKDRELITQHLTAVGGRNQMASAIASALSDRSTLNDWTALYMGLLVAVGVDFAMNQQGYIIDLDTTDRAKASSDDKLNELMTRYMAGYAGTRVVSMLSATSRRVAYEVSTALADGYTTSQVHQALDDVYDVLGTDGALHLADFETISAGNAGMDIGAGALNIGLSKTWLAIHDGKTREWHAEMDGVTVDYNEPFEVDGEQLMFPTDTSLGASGKNIYNCRCMSMTQPTQS